MHSMSHFWRLSRKIYGPRNAQENKRAVVFFFRAVTNRSLFEELYAFFEAYPPMQGFFETHDPDFQEVMTRVFLFKNSTMRQRLDALLHHFTILRSFFSDEVIHKIYWESGYALWKSEDSTLPLEARLLFDTGQRKEGFLSLGLYHEQEMIYHFNFRFDYNADGIPSIYIGTLQGSKHGLDTTKALTKKLFGYRPKNFILYLLRIFIQTLGIHDFYVITDEGFYTNSHVLRGNRSKKTNFDDFWIDEGAVPDPREAWYFRMPIEEKRRKYGDIKSQKRNLFRKRYLLMDQIIPAYIQSVRTLFRNGFAPVPSAQDEAAILDKPAGYDPIEAPTDTNA